MTKTQLKNKIEKYLKEQETDIDKVLSNTELFNEIDYRLASAVSEIGLEILDIKNDADAYTTIQFYSKSLGYSIVLNEDFWIGDHSASSFYDQIKRELDKAEQLETKMKKNDCIKNLIKAIKDNTEWTKDENGNGLGLINREYINEEIEVLETKLKGLN